VDDADREAAFVGALNNEYFVLQSAASTTVSESGTRASLFVLSLSSTLVALGFVSQSDVAFAPFLAVVLPTVFVLGVFTTVRLVDTGIQNVAYIRAMAKIRHYWAELTPEAPDFFGSPAPDGARAALATVAVRWERQAGSAALRASRVAEFFTIASMIATVTSVVGGTGVTLLVDHVLDQDQLAVPLTLGIAAGLLFLAAFFVYQHFRYRQTATTG
jgi:hypothetical protein